MITAFVLFTISPGSVAQVAASLTEVAGITEVFSVAGPYDLVAIARVERHDDLADLITQHVATLAGVTRTETLIAFRAYSKRDIESTWDLGNA